MKRLIGGIILLAVLLSLCGMSFAYVDSKVEKMAEQVSDMMQIVQLEGTEEAREETNALCVDWNSTEETLSMFIRHEELDELSENLEALAGCVLSGDQEHYIQICYEILNQISHLKASEGISLRNVF